MIRPSPAHDARDTRPEERREDERDAPLAAGTEQCRRGEENGEERERQDDVGESHQDVVDDAAVVAGERADNEPDQRRDDCDEDAYLERRANPEDGATELVAADRVVAEDMRTRRSVVDEIEVERSRALRSDEVREDPGAENEDQPEEA
jgi:hypothetical protein